MADGTVKVGVSTGTGRQRFEQINVTTSGDELGTSLSNDLVTYLTGGLLAIGTLTVSGANAAKFKTTTTAYYRINGIQYSKAATDNLVFSASDTINTGTDTGVFYGAWGVDIDAAGTVTTVSVGADQVYASAAAAVAAVPAVVSTKSRLGIITVGAKTGAAWTANTSELNTGGSGGSAVTFTDGTPISIPSTVT
jgi:hypothetical protein